MPSLFVLLLLGLAAIPGWVALSAVRRLRGEVETLRARLNAFDGQPESIDADGVRPTRQPDAIPEAAMPEEEAPAQAEAARPASARTIIPRMPRRPFSSRSREQSEVLGRLWNWLTANWIYPLAGAALVLGAIYLVQYAIERDMISPRARISLAMGLAVALIAAAEGLRRKWPAGEAGLVPATLAGAGVATGFAAILAAHLLYDLIGPEGTLGALALVAAFSIVLGWIHGSFLAGLGILAGAAAPFLLGEAGAPRPILYLHFGAVAVLGLGMDSFRRWGWVSSLAVAAPLAGAVLIAQAGAGSWGLVLLATLIALLSSALPFGMLTPRHASPDALLRPDRHSLAALLSCAGGSVAIGSLVPDVSAVTLGLGGFLLAMALWTRMAPGLANLLALPAAALFGAVVFVGLDAGRVVGGALMQMGWLPAAILGLTVAALAEGATRREGMATIALVAMGLLPGAVLLAMDLTWELRLRAGSMDVAYLAMGLAAGYTLLAARSVRDGRTIPLGLGVTGAYAMIALALTAVLDGFALTLSLAVLMVVAVLTDRRWPIGALGLVIGAAAAGLGWRFLIDPGVASLMTIRAHGGTSDIEAVATVAVTIGAPVIALVMWPGGRDVLRSIGRAGIESLLSFAIPIGVMIVWERLLGTASSHAMIGVQIGVVLTMIVVRLRRIEKDEGLIVKLSRIVVMIGQGAALLVLVALLLSLLNPVWGGWNDEVRGPAIVNDLLLAFLVPALALGVTAYRGYRPKRVLWALCGAFVALWVQASLRHVWVGAQGMDIANGFRQGELYSYTVALLVAGALGMALALRWRSHSLRRVALGLIGLAAAKALLIDGSGLSGLLRVGAFLSVGLALAGLAWLNGWAARQIGSGMSGTRSEQDKG